MRRLQTRVPEQLALACLGAVAIFIAGFLFLKPPSPATAPELLKYALEKLEKQVSYRLAIEEYSPGYRLLFKGKVQNCTEIKGEIMDHCLEVHRKGKKLYVKPEDETEWQTAEKLQLSSLNSFITLPAEVLKAQQGNFARFVFVPEIESRRKIHFETGSPDKKFTELFFPKISPTSVCGLTIEVVAADPGPVIKQIEIGLEFQDSAYGNLTRVYCLD